MADAAWFAKTTDRIVATMEGGRAHLAVLARLRRGPAPGPRRRTCPPTRSAPGRRPAGQRGPRRPLGAHRPPARRRSPSRPSCAASTGPRSTPSAGVRPVHLEQGPRRRAAPGRRRRPPRRLRRRRRPAVDLALLESDANGVTLNAGQATLVREMATSGARLQLAIAPAGSGKTTAMRALARPGPTAAAASSAWPRQRRPRTRCAAGPDRHPRPTPWPSSPTPSSTGDAAPTGSPASAPRRSW